MRMHHSVTWSAEIPVGSSARAMRIPIGRKNRRSTHSSIATPLCDKSFGGFTEHIPHGGQRGHRVVFLNDERRGDSGFPIVDHCDHAAPEPRVEDPTSRLPVE